MTTPLQQTFLTDSQAQRLWICGVYGAGWCTGGYSVVLRIYRKTRMQQLENQVSLVFWKCFCLGLPHVLDAFWAVLEVRNCFVLVMSPVHCECDDVLFPKEIMEVIAKLQFEHCIGDHFEIRKKWYKLYSIKRWSIFCLVSHMNMEPAGFLGVAILSNIIW